MCFRACKTNSNISNRGILKLINVESNTTIRLFTQSNNMQLLNNIGTVVCREFGFKALSYITALSSSQSLRSQLGSDSAYLDFVNTKSLNGLQCQGTELTLKECSAPSNATASTLLFDLDMECSCKLNVAD